jgi:PAS domain S-box-containing protein
MRVVKTLFASPYVDYALAAAAAGTAALSQWLILPLVGGQAPFLPFLLALGSAVIFLGRGPALLVLLVGIVDSALRAAPVGSLEIYSVQDLAAVLIFAAAGLLIVGFGTRLRFTTARAALAEQRLALAQENTGVGIFELNFEAGMAFVSPSLCQMLGREIMPGEIDLGLWLGGLRAEHVEESRRVMQEHIARGEFRYEREQKIARPDGETRWLLNRVELVATATGVLRVARGVAVDITQRKRIDELLQRAQSDLQQQLQDESRLHTFSQNLVVTGDDLPAALQSLLDVTLEIYGARHGIVSLRSAENGNCQAIAQAGFADEAIERRSEESILERHRALAAEENLQGVQSLPLLSAQGETLGILSVMRAEPLAHCEREKRLAEVCAASAAAIVERERARAAATKNEKRFSVALESSVVPFTILTPVRRDNGLVVDFVWTYINPAAARAMGREVADLTGRGIGTVFPLAWDAPGLFARYLSVLERDEQCEFEMQTAATNQGVRWYNVLAAPLEGSVAVWFTNITARKKYEENLREADRRKDEFLATLAHELRNPLAPIRQGVRIAAAAKSTDAQRRWSHAIIERQVQHMSLLLDDLLDVSRIGRGTLLLRKSSELLSVVMDTALEASRPHLEAKRHRLEKSLPPTPVILEIDPVRIAQVLGNLLTNAAKYTDPEGQIFVSAQREGPDFVIRVKDNGIGLTREQQTLVFEMFSQVPAALEQSQGGLGIGLALARGLVELHGGTIRASSAGLGHGTEMIVRLPGSCIVSERGGPPELLAASPGAVETHSKRCILIADDNVDAADSLAELLRLEGYEVHVAYDGAGALATFARVVPDAALLDVGMPDVSGLEVVRAIRQQPTGQRATLIAVTGWGQERDRLLALEAGFDHHLTKPMPPEVIFDLIQRGRMSEHSSDGFGKCP